MNKDIGGLDIPMKDVILVAKVYPLQDFLHYLSAFTQRVGKSIARRWFRTVLLIGKLIQPVLPPAGDFPLEVAGQVLHHNKSMILILHNTQIYKSELASIRT